MLEIFRKNLFFNSLLLLPYACIVRIRSLIWPEAYQLQAEDGYLNHLIFTALSEYPLVQSILAIALIFFQATFVNYIVNKNRIARLPNLFSGLVYILLVSMIADFQILSPVLIATTFLLMSLNSCFKCSKKQHSSSDIFNTSFFIGLASFFYFPFIVFLIAGYIGMLIIRSFKIKERMQFLAGLIIPFFLFATYFNWYDVISKYLVGYVGNNISMPSLNAGVSYYQIIALGGFLALALFAFVRYGDIRKKKNVAAQKKIDILYWFLFLTIPTLFFWNSIDLRHLIMLTPMLSVFIGMYLLGLKNKGMAEIIHIIALLTLLIPQFSTYI